MADDRLIPASILDDSTRAYNEMLERLGSIDLTVLLVYIIDLVPAEALPYLLEQFHVTGYEGGALAETDDQRRALIKNSIMLHKKKGTRAAIRGALLAAGCGVVDIIERAGEAHYDGARNYNGLMTYGTDDGGWAAYNIVMQRPFTRDQGDLIRALCEEFAPARCVLRSVVYTEVANRYNGAIAYDNSHTYGSM